MRKIFLLLLLILSGQLIFAQVAKDTLSAADKALLDSMLANDEFLNMLDQKTGSYTDIYVSAGNGLFSENNQAVNATGVSNQIVLTPGVVYHFKGGFSIGAAGFFTKEDGSSGMSLYQTGLSAAYDYDGDAVKAGISYTRFLSDRNKYNTKSLYQNDLFSYVKKAKGIIQPGLSLGFASGNYKEVFKTKYRRPLIGDTILVKDSTNNKASYFSATISVGHDFSIYKIFSDKDELDIVPSVFLNSGSDKTTITHTNRLYDRLPANSRLKKTQAENNKFQLQSLAFSLDLTYSIGKFFIQPNIYLDYYLPSTTSKRFSSIYSLTAGFSF